ncbi:MAG: TonB-dependent receptor [Sandarakinorhabdus sp.]|nr:TonB-dependent receptor [Sandarakinorhabdus sp.]
MMPNLQGALLAGIAAGALFTGQSAAAQEDAAQQAALAPGLQDIVVTATRRAIGIADVPIAVSAIGESALRNSGTTDIRQLNQLAPSLLVSTTGSEANTSARIRGIGTVGDNAGLESSVAIFVDGVYRSRTGVGMNELGEVERIEVLRGPQGTLFGRNASAGLIHIITKAPEFELRGYGFASYGSHDYLRLEGGVTGPITSTLAARLEAVHESRSGFYLDVTSGDSINTRDRYMLRGQLLFEPTDALSVRAIADYSKRSEACCGAVFATDAVAPGNSAALNPANNPIVRVLDLLAPGTLDDIYPALGDPFSRRMALSPGRSFAGETKDYGGSVEISWNPGAVNLTSLTAYREYRNSQGSDADYNLVDLLWTSPGPGRRFYTFSQEIRLQGALFDDRLDWLVGGYYSNEILRSSPTLKFGSQYGQYAACRVVSSISFALVSAAAPGCLSPTGRLVLGGSASPTVRALDLLSRVANVGDEGTRYRQESNSFALFTHNIVRLTDRLDATLGLRYTRESKDFNAVFDNSNIFCPQIRALLPAASGITTLGCLGNSSSELNSLDIEDRMTEQELTGTAVLSWKPVDDLLVYASYSRGYKAGGFNLDRSALGSPNRLITNADVAQLRFDPETVRSVEVGVKYAVPSFSIAIAGFRSEFENFQLNTFDGTVFIVETINGCSASLGGADRDTSPLTGACDPGDIVAGVVTQGVEIEAAMSPLPHLNIGVGMTYADTRYADHLVGDALGAPLNPVLRRLPGEQISNAAEFVVTSSLSYTPPIGNGGLSGLFFVNARMMGDYNTGSSLGNNRVQDGFVVVNGRVGLRGPDERWAIELWGQNILNTDYSQVIFDSALQNTFSAFLAEPRTYGVTARFRF